MTRRTVEKELGIKTGGGIINYTPEHVAELQTERARKLIAICKALRD